jgi:EAL domain-containing protein (putative c-di-GMP-specific phosphodiesterase class I)
MRPGLIPLANSQLGGCGTQHWLPPRTVAIATEWRTRADGRWDPQRLRHQWHTMTIEQSTDTMWLLSGQVNEGEPVREIPINSYPFQVGRRSDVSLRIQSPTVSNLHAEIIERDGQLMLRDLGSTNGTFLNGQQIPDEAFLREGNLVQFANVVFRLKRVDEAVGSETLQGKNCDRTMALIQFDRLMTERAVIPYFQPIFRSVDNEVVGYEVLVRSRPFGLKTPHAMFQAAAQLNLESELSRLCRRVGIEASTQLTPPTRIYLNTHPSEMGDMVVLQLSVQELREAFPYLPITLEIHEAAITSPDVMRGLKAALNDLDIQLAYDDFGAGQARLIELVEVPPHVLKFDRALIMEIDQASAQRQHMLASLVRMVRELGILPLAEGMETEMEAKTCVQLGFELNQGFFYGRPAPIEEVL